MTFSLAYFQQLVHAVESKKVRVASAECTTSRLKNLPKGCMEVVLAYVQLCTTNSTPQRVHAQSPAQSQPLLEFLHPAIEIAGVYERNSRGGHGKIRGFWRSAFVLATESLRYIICICVYIYIYVAVPHGQSEALTSAILHLGRKEGLKSPSTAPQQKPRASRYMVVKKDGLEDLVP